MPYSTLNIASLPGLNVSMVVTRVFYLMAVMAFFFSGTRDTPTIANSNRELVFICSCRNTNFT